MTDLRPTAADPDADPYLWLEDVDGLPALAWVEAQNAATLARLGNPALDADREALRAILDRPDNIPYVTRRGGLLYNFWRDAGHKRGLWRRTTMDSYRTDAPDWDILLDLDALAAAEAEDWLWRGAETLGPGHTRALIRLSRGGGDAVVLREFDLGARQFLPEGFTLPEAKGGATWLDADTTLLTTALGEGNATTSGYARTVRLWARGTSPADAPVLFEVTPDRMSAGAGYERETDIVFYVAQLGFFDTDLWLGDRTGPKQRLDLPTDCEKAGHRGILVVRLRTPWESDGTTYPADTLLGLELDGFLAGNRNFNILHSPTSRLALQDFFWAGDRLVISLLDELQPRFGLVTPNKDWERAAIVIEGRKVRTTTVWPLDTDSAESDGSLLAVSQTPLSPPVFASFIDESLQPLKHAPAAFDPGGAVATLREVLSHGERVPYVQVGPPGAHTDAPVYMTGYGGFAISMLPGYMPRAGKLWIERGGTVVIANIRGGGEFGTRWHEAGRRERKSRSHDDFAAVAADLVARGITRPGRIAAEGGSNGGLLIANMLTRYPERFGALFCTIPLIDMRRYHRLLAGASWVAEYGDPDVPEDWAFMRGFSAYHAAEPGRPYPPILLATTRRDDRVHPGHARKMAAKLQTLGYSALFYEPSGGGHGFGRDNAEAAAFGAMGMTFLRRAIGWEAG